MKPPARRWALLSGVGLLVVVLVGGRWLALETAERAWAATLPGGGAYLAARDFARTVSGLLLLGAVAWCTGNLLFVYRSIGSMQLSRRLGDLEIVEAVPQRLLLAGTIASGVVLGFLLVLGTGDWWMSAALASRPPIFGVTDPVIHQDLGYYLALLPWTERLRELALVAVSSATVVIALLYVGIGSLRFRRWLPYANAHARAHLGVLLALLALTLTWGALLDPAEAVGGLHGVITARALEARLSAAPLVAGLGAATTVVSLVWGLREKPVLLVAAWGALIGASLLGFALIPGSLSNSAGPGEREAGGVAIRDTTLGSEQRRLEGMAFGVTTLMEHTPPGFPSPEAAAVAVPIWDAQRVMAAVRRDLIRPRTRPAAAELSARAFGGGRATWIVALRPDLDSLALRPPLPDWSAIHRGAWARVGPPLAAVENDTVLEFTPIATGDSTSWFGPRFTEFAVAAPDTWPALRRSGIQLAGWWRRTALAWALQSPALARREADGLVLLWRRDVPGRLQRLAPFATFSDAVPVVADSALWWLAYGYLEAEAFPLARPLEGDGRAVRYLHAGLLGTVNASSGDTRLYLAPGADSLAAAWAALLAPLVRPLDSLPTQLRLQLPFPRRSFRAATALVDRWRADTGQWTPRPREPFELVAPAGEVLQAGGPRVWTAQGFEAGSTLAALVAGEMSPTPAGPRLFLWRPVPAVRLRPVVGSPDKTAPGVLRLWSAGGPLFSAQALFAEPATGAPASGIDTVFLSWGERHGQGRSVAAALHDLLATSGARAPVDTALTARWQRAQRLAEQADAALAAGDLETFGKLYRELEQLLGVRRGKLAPTPQHR